MERLVDEGLARSIGISNFNGQLILDLLRYAKIVPATLQIEHHPYLTQEGLVKLARDHGIAVTAYSSFGPQSFLELDMQRAKDTPLLFDNPTIKSIAEKKGKTPAQVLLRWATQRGIAVIPKSNNQGRLAQNLDVTAWELEQGELDEISGLDKGLRFNDPLNVSFESGILGVLTVDGLLTFYLPSTALPCRFTYKRGQNLTLPFRFVFSSFISPTPMYIRRNVHEPTNTHTTSSTYKYIPTSHSNFHFYYLPNTTEEKEPTVNL